MTRGPGHYHPELWTIDQQHRYEDRMSAEIEKLERAVDRLTQRVTVLMGAIGLLIFLIPVIAPFIRGFLLDLP